MVLHTNGFGAKVLPMHGLRLKIMKENDNFERFSNRRKANGKKRNKRETRSSRHKTKTNIKSEYYYGYNQDQ